MPNKARRRSTLTLAEGTIIKSSPKTAQLGVRPNLGVIPRLRYAETITHTKIRVIRGKVKPFPIELIICRGTHLPSGSLVEGLLKW
jgi:hypothetical protein